MTLALVRPRKIPAECPSCGRLLSREDMEKFLHGCEESGDDPFEIAFANEQHPGIQCTLCYVRSIVEAAEDGNVAAKRFVLHARMEVLGLKIVR